MSVSARLKHVEALRFNVELPDGRRIELNSAEAMKHAFTPMELFLVSLAGCTAMDVQWILNRQRQEVRKLEIAVRGVRRDKDPRYFETIDLEYILQGPKLRKEGVERAIRLSEEKYCSVRAMLKDSVRINISYRIQNGTERRHEYSGTA